MTMRLAVLLALVFVGLSSMWAFTGVRIMRCALGIELRDDVQLDGVSPPGEWLVRLAKTGGQAVPHYEHRELDSF
jgi:hypothetical protein